MTLKESNSLSLPPSLPLSLSLSLSLFLYILAETSEIISKRRAKVAYNYTAENEDELSLAVGDIVEIVRDEEEGFWYGRVNGKDGLIPYNFEELIEEEEPPPYSSKTVLICTLYFKPTINSM